MIFVAFKNLIAEFNKARTRKLLSESICKLVASCNFCKFNICVMNVTHKNRSRTAKCFCLLMPRKPCPRCIATALSSHTAIGMPGSRNPKSSHISLTCSASLTESLALPGAQIWCTTFSEKSPKSVGGRPLEHGVISPH